MTISHAIEKLRFLAQSDCTLREKFSNRIKAVKPLRFLNNYLRERYSEKNLTTFTFRTFSRCCTRPLSASTEKVISQALALLRDGDNFYDIGGNVGLVTMSILKKRNAIVTLFEPVPLYRDYCRLLFAEHPNVTVVGKALADTSGMETIWVSRDNLGRNTLVEGKKTREQYPVQIETITLNDYWSATGRPSIALLKIDVEGAEFRLFRGAHDMLSRSSPPILVEIGWGKSHPHYAEQKAEFEWLFANGYQRFDYEFEGTQDMAIMPLQARPTV